MCTHVGRWRSSSQRVGSKLGSVLAAIPAAVLTGVAFSSCVLAYSGTLGRSGNYNALFRFIITPLAFLSGTFYSTERLPDLGRFLAHLNPFFYMIDGFRYGVIGHADGSLVLGAVALIGVNLALLVGNYLSFQYGSRLRP